MRIRMYDCGFGDCFQIDEESTEIQESVGETAETQTKIIEESHLMVDCGWEKYSDVFEKIKEANKESQQSLSFLLTHYHEDHFRGFCEIIEHPPKNNERLTFDKIYIPDIWNANTDVEFVALLLMSELKKGKLFLIDFLINLLKSNGTCCFVKADDIIEDRYLALWPQKEYISSKAKEDFNRVWKDETGSSNAIAMHELASELIDIVASWKGKNNDNNRNQLGDLLRLKDIQQSYVGNKGMHGIKGVRIGLADYGNNASIVFQSNDITPNILFTGDFPRVFWTIIKDKLLKKYDVVKIPHHGTEAYYWEDIHGYFADGATILIPNGNAGGHGWYIWYKYPEHLKRTRANYRILCFGMNACPVALGNGHKCVCTPNGGCIPELKSGESFIEFTIPRKGK